MVPNPASPTSTSFLATTCRKFSGISAFSSLASCSPSLASRLGGLLVASLVSSSSSGVPEGWARGSHLTLSPTHRCLITFQFTKYLPAHHELPDTLRSSRAESARARSLLAPHSTAGKPEAEEGSLTCPRAHVEYWTKPAQSGAQDSQARICLWLGRGSFGEGIPSSFSPGPKGTNVQTDGKCCWKKQHMSGKLSVSLHLA